MDFKVRMVPPTWHQLSSGLGARYKLNSIQDPELAHRAGNPIKMGEKINNNPESVSNV